ncbi:hypothetical protein OVA24_17420 [Luteolibacter sp. SL250]|uniref:hypothetical protein n=1 Tax=Luteolibacter sp. SL250 TaxID=2995170 RepID=UPI00226FCADF|nr:hypothetical protein [Luteolibacter sp. SL250]WAC19012.1 hypothetical protein OVA24_17420 [Luteolibacter sp. SL250]
MTFGEIVILCSQGVITLGAIVWASYFKKRAENLATIDDLRRMTEIPEGVKSRHVRANAVHKAQFDLEFGFYQKLWIEGHHLVTLYGESGHPEFDNVEHLRNLLEATNAFDQLLLSAGPFISDEIGRSFHALPSAIRAKSNKSHEIWRQTMETFNKTGAMIKKRIAEMHVLD